MLVVTGMRTQDSSDPRRHPDRRARQRARPGSPYPRSSPAGRGARTRSPRACRCSPTAPSAPPTSSSRTAPAAPTSGTPPTAPASASATDTNGCQARSLPLGTRVRFAEGATLATAGTTLGHGTLAYSSWRTMRSVGTTDNNTCAANDFALVRVDAADAGKVNPTVPFWGGPTGLRLRRGGRQPGLLLRPVQPAAHDRPLARRPALSLGCDPRRLGDRRLHRHPGRPRRLRQRLPRRPGPRRRHPLDRRASPRSPAPTASATSPASWTSRSGTRASPGCAWSRAPARSRPSPDALATVGSAA